MFPPNYDPARGNQDPSGHLERFSNLLLSNFGGAASRKETQRSLKADEKLPRKSQTLVPPGACGSCQ